MKNILVVFFCIVVALSLSACAADTAKDSNTTVVVVKTIQKEVKTETIPEECDSKKYYYKVVINGRTNVRSSMTTTDSSNIICCGLDPYSILLPAGENPSLDAFYMHYTWGGAYFDDTDRNWIIFDPEDVLSVPINYEQCNIDVIYWFRKYHEKCFIATDVVSVAIVEF